MKFNTNRPVPDYEQYAEELESFNEPPRINGRPTREMFTLATSNPDSAAELVLSWLPEVEHILQGHNPTVGVANSANRSRDEVVFAYCPEVTDNEVYYKAFEDSDFTVLKIKNRESFGGGSAVFVTYEKWCEEFNVHDGYRNYLENEWRASCSGCEWSDRYDTKSGAQGAAAGHKGWCESETTVEKL